MRLAKIELETGDVRLAIVEESHLRLLLPEAAAGDTPLSDLLYADDPERTARSLVDEDAAALPFAAATWLPPVERQEVWGAGVTYQRSKQARMEESEGAASFYDLVYAAERPELFFKANAHRVAGHGGRVHIRRDSRWSVPEPELALVLSPELHLVGYTIGNDMSARDIEGENPLYLPQAKVYDACCALGPCVLVGRDSVAAPGAPARDETAIAMQIRRGDTPLSPPGRGVGGEGDSLAFEGRSTLARMARTFDDLISWLGREASFPDGAILLTGTGIVPPDDFALEPGDRISITITGIGTLVNTVAHRCD